MIIFDDNWSKSRKMESPFNKFRSSVKTRSKKSQKLLQLVQSWFTLSKSSTQNIGKMVKFKGKLSTATIAPIKDRIGRNF